MIELVKHHIRTSHPLVYLGTNAGGVNHPDRATPKPIWVSFAAAHPDRIPHVQTIGSGQNNKLYASFRDVWLPQALREIRAETSATSLPTRAATLPTRAMRPTRAATLPTRAMRPARPPRPRGEAVVKKPRGRPPKGKTWTNQGWVALSSTESNEPNEPNEPDVIHAELTEKAVVKKRPRGRAPKGMKWSDGGWVKKRGHKRARGE